MCNPTEFPAASRTIALINAIPDFEERVRAALRIISIARASPEDEGMAAIASCGVSDEGYITGIVRR